MARSDSSSNSGAASVAASLFPQPYGGDPLASLAASAPQGQASGSGSLPPRLRPAGMAIGRNFSSIPSVNTPSYGPSTATRFFPGQYAAGPLAQPNVTAAQSQMLAGPAQPPRLGPAGAGNGPPRLPADRNVPYSSQGNPASPYAAGPGGWAQSLPLRMASNIWGAKATAGAGGIPGVLTPQEVWDKVRYTSITPTRSPGSVNSQHPVAVWAEAAQNDNPYGYTLASTNSEVHGKSALIGGVGAPKCNAFVYDAIEGGGRDVGRINGRIPVAKEWGNPGSGIKGYHTVTSPAEGDVASNGHHVGIVVTLDNGKLGTVSAATPDAPGGVALPFGKVLKNDWGFRDGQRKEMVFWRADQDDKGS